MNPKNCSILLFAVTIAVQIYRMIARMVAWNLTISYFFSLQTHAKKSRHCEMECDSCAKHLFGRLILQHSTSFDGTTKKKLF